MGCCCSRSSDPLDYQIKVSLASAKEEDSHVIKLLLLGAGASGKSTLFKQLQYIHENGFDQRSRKTYITYIHDQLIDSMKSLITKCEDYYTKDPIENKKFQLYNYNNEEDEDSYEYDDDGDMKIEDDLLDKNNDKSNLLYKSHGNVSSQSINISYADDIEDDNENKIQSAAQYIFTFRNSIQRHSLSKTPKVVQHLRLLWKHSAIQAMYERRNEICVPDSTAYFYENLDRVTRADYIPNDDDLLLVRHKTTGMQEKNFNVKGHPFKVCDVGGQRSERRKWIHFFDNVTAVLFVVSLSCYDEVIFEESSDNAMMESYKIFDEQIKYRAFIITPFILFLNKSDLFSIKIKSVPITIVECFQSYVGIADDEMAAIAHIKDTFVALNNNPDRTLFTHVTCATDRSQIEKVFNDVQTMILNWSLQTTGLM